MKTLGLHLVEALASHGVQHVFGIPGVHNLELYRGLAKGPIRHVTGRHEQGVGFMADGYARVSGRPGVCFTITGPGVTNIATAMGQAYGDSVPLLVISSQNRRGEAGSGRGFLHELPDQRALAGNVAAKTFAVARAEELPAAIDAAFELFSSARPRPVYIEVPLDILASDASGLSNRRNAAIPAAEPEASAIAAAAAQLRKAANVVMLAGGGAIRAAPELRRLAERLDAPVVMTVNARGVLPEGHPLAVPMSPSLGAIRELIMAADVVLAVGTEMGPTDYDMYGVREFSTPRQLIRIDIDTGQLMRGAQPQLAVCADAGATLRALLSSDLGPAHPHGGAARAASACAASLAEIARDYPAMAQHLGLLRVIAQAVPKAILVGDSTQTVYAGNLGFNVAAPGSWFNSATGFGTLGYAVPASAGASLAAPDRPVVCLVGDGGLQFTMGELALLRDVSAWAAIIIWNNRGYGEIRTSMLAAGIDPEGVDVQPPDFACLAQAFGYAYRKIGSQDALAQALSQFGARRQIVVIEIPANNYFEGHPGE